MRIVRSRRESNQWFKDAANKLIEVIELESKDSQTNAKSDGDKDANNNWGNKYHIEWSISSNPLFRGEGYTSSYTDGLYIPKYINGNSGTQILPEPLEIQIQVGQSEVDVPGKDLNRFDVFLLYVLHL